MIVGSDKLEVIPKFCNLGDMLSSGVGCELATVKLANFSHQQPSTPVDRHFEPPAV